MILSNDGFDAFHYRSYGTFFLQQNRLHNIHMGFTHYRYYRAGKTLLNQRFLFLPLVFLGILFFKKGYQKKIQHLLYLKK